MLLIGSNWGFQVVLWYEHVTMQLPQPCICNAGVKRLIVLICQSSTITRPIQSLRNTQTSNFDGIMTHTHGNHTNIHILIHVHLKMAEASLFHYYHRVVPPQQVINLQPHSQAPHFGMRMLKLCRWGEPGIFSHVSSIKGRKEVERP